MDKKLQLILHLYGESEDRGELRDLLKDEALNHEYQELSESKFWLDHSTHERPEKDVLDTILAAAAEASAASGVQSVQQDSPSTLRSRNADRAPAERPVKQRRRLFGPITAVFTLLVTVGIGYQFMQSPATLNGVLMQESLSSTDANAPQKSSDEGFAASAKEEEASFADLDAELQPLVADLATESDASGARSSLGSSAGSAMIADTSLPDWNDDLDEVLRFQRRIDMLLEQNKDLGWDEAAVPLELLPSSRSANPALLQAGSKKSNPGNR